MPEDVESLVLTVAAAGPDGLDEQVVSTIAGNLPAAGVPCWLEPGVACDIPLAAPALDRDGDMLQAEVRAVLGNRPVDIALQPASGRRKRLLIADMDSTIVVGETLDELAAHAGLKDRIAAITERAMRGELAFEAALRERVAMLRGLSDTALAQTYARLEPMPGAAALIATMKAHGAFTALVSGGFSYFTARVRDRLGFDMDSANELEIVDGKLTGRAVEPIRGRDAKQQTLTALCEQRNLTTAAALAVGDGANDLGMIGAAGMGVAFHAKPAVRAAARFRVDHGDLTTLLYFQGYRREEIVATQEGAP